MYGMRPDHLYQISSENQASGPSFDRSRHTAMSHKRTLNHTSAAFAAAAALARWV